METIKKSLLYLLAVLAGMWAGFYIGTQYYPRVEMKTVEVEKPIIVKGEATTETKTQIAYVPKETVIYKYIDPATGEEVTAARPENTDLDAQIGKMAFDIKLNGKEVRFTKAEDERFVFDKKKIAMTQESKITIDARVSPVHIDDTRRWEIGVGYGSNGVAYKVDFPIGNNNDWGGWVYKDDKIGAGGVALRF